MLQLHTRYRQPGGEDVAVRHERRLLERAGHDVRSVVMTNPAGTGDSLRALARSSWNTTAARHVGTAVDEFRPDVVHVHNTWYAMSHSVISAAARRAAVVMSLHNYRLACVNALLARDGAPCEACVGTHPWRAVQHACYRSSRAQSAVAAASIAVHRSRGTWDREVDRFLALTPFAAGRMADAGLPEHRMLVRPHSTEDPGTRPAPPSASGDVLVIGRVSPEKGVRVAVTAMEKSKAAGLRLVVIGDGPELEPLKRLAGAGVSFAGGVPHAEVRDRLRSARALLFPSVVYETFGLTMVEAMAAGTPVLASDIGGASWVVGDAGRLAAVGNVDAWVAALTELEDDELVDELGTRARRRWSAHFSPRSGLRGLETAYAEALDASVGRRAGGGP